MYDRLVDAIEEARRLVSVKKKTMTVYKYRGKYTVLPLEDCLNAELFSKGRVRITSATMNARGQVI
jgi:hypothetical protein